MARILVVDDEPLVCDMLRATLAVAGHDAVVAENGRQALRLFADEPADVVITDIFMPEMEGLETSRVAAELNFPLLDVHPKQEEVFRTAARLKDTYDQIALLIRDSRLPDYGQNKIAGQEPDAYDYGVFNFVELFVCNIDLSLVSIYYALMKVFNGVFSFVCCVQSSVHAYDCFVMNDDTNIITLLYKEKKRVTLIH